jgi:hypothetical protein
MGKRKNAVTGSRTRPLPVASLGEMAELGHELHVWCQRCKTSRRIEITSALWARPFAGARFRCARILWDGKACSGSGVASLRPSVRAAIGARYANLHCESCVPPWEILEIDHRSPPWSLPAGMRFRCPACGGMVAMREHGPPWRPTYDAR